jgi:hypothetical protein
MQQGADTEYFGDQMSQHIFPWTVVKMSNVLHSDGIFLLQGFCICAAGIV